ncbi:MAG: DUF4123 domain-containing protein [Azoarcus sp.]|nr:DUF4123 domain-containing protein [Azoarcus sp.]
MKKPASTDFIRHHQYAVVDRLNVFPEPWFKSAPMIPLVPGEFRNDAESLPALLPIDPGADWFPGLLEEFAVSEESGDPPPFLNLLVVPKDVKPDTLARHLTNRLIIYFQQGKGYLRYFDPKNFVHFNRFLRPAQIQALYGPVKEWSIYFDKRWITEPEPGVTENVPSFWSVRPGQYAVLDRLRVVNQALFFWREDLDRPWESLDEFRAYANLADEITIQELQALPPDARDEDIVDAVSDQFPKDFHFNRIQTQ